ncbi:Sugar phosphate isomerase/epimerase [Frankia canadensis]|uniref:Sugar phosphate isomerase/epimerase n=1 Tax=Frankia canadensis TaxID=1836972 RepID=A0A2I2KPK7_9ACTN|nr:sugar phosphate isomerase/epimerase family protein [Frankia canadensis]SNQ47601.1 Sugar phosphate isomerase/epimerase [Frankia canadensis]SOU54891.1 Sugar phosphate isomerase/epimerase [Frankia canadensis]
MSRGVGAAAPFRPCLNPATLSGVDLPDFLTLAAAGGFTAVELSIQQAQAMGAGRVRDLLSEHGLTVAAASGILPAGPVLPAPLLVDTAAYDEHLMSLPARLKTFAALGCPVATSVLNPYSSLGQSEALALARTRIAHLADTAAEYGVCLAVEAVSVREGLPSELNGPHPVAATLPAVAELLHDSGSRNAAVLVDSFHWAVAGADPGHITALGTGGVAHVQIADVPHVGAAHGWTDRLRLFPGDGALNWSAFANALHQVGYHGPASVELFNPVLRALPEGEIAARSHQAATGCWIPQEAGR